MMVNEYAARRLLCTRPCESLTARHVCCLSSTQIDRSLCMTMMFRGTSYTTCTLCPGIVEGTRQDCTRWLFRSSPGIAGSPICNASRRVVLTGRADALAKIGARSGRTCAAGVATCAISCRKPRTAAGGLSRAASPSPPSFALEHVPELAERIGARRG